MPSGFDFESDYNRAFPDRPPDRHAITFVNELRAFKRNMNRIKEKNMIPTKVTKKYYVGKSSVINSDWAHANLNDAISHGKALCESSEEDQIIVQVIRVIRVQKRPILVQTVK